MAPPFDSAERKQELQARLDSIDGITVARSVGFPNIPLSALADEEVRRQFLAVQGWVLAESRVWLQGQTLGGA